MKRNVVRRSLAWLLVLVMALSAVPFGVFAESAEQVSNAGTEEAPGGAVSPVEPQQEEPKQEEPKPEEPKQEEPKVQDIQDEDTQVEAAQKCLCEDAAKCTEDFVNEKCPVCAEKDANLEKVCKGKTQEQLNAEAEAKKAEEEAEKGKDKNNAASGVDKIAAEDGVGEASVVSTENYPSKEDIKSGLACSTDSDPNGTGSQRENSNATITYTYTDNRNEAAWFMYSSKKWGLGSGTTITLEPGITYALVPNGENFKIPSKLWNTDKTLIITVDISNYSQETGEGMTVSIAQGLPLTISFDAQGGSTVSNVTLNETRNLGSSLPTPNRENYVFQGWYRGSSEGSPIDGNTLFYEDTTLYAKWAAAYTVTFDSNGGSFVGGGAESDVSCVYGAEVTAPAVGREGHRLVGWAKDANGTDKVTQLTNLTSIAGGNVKLYAVWEKVQITLTGEGLTNEVWTVGSHPQGAELPNHPKTGFVFSWVLGDKTYTTVDYNANGGNDYNLTAQWVPITYTVTFDGNGGKMSGDAESATITATYDTEITPQPTPNRDGYTFRHWATDDGKEVTQWKNLTAEQGKNVTVRAVWERTMPTVSGDGSITVEVTDKELNEILGSDSDTLTIENATVDRAQVQKDLGLDGNTNVVAVNVTLLKNGTVTLTEISRTLCFTMDVSGLNLNILQVQRNHNGWAPMLRLAAKPTDGKTEGFYLEGNTLYIYSKLFSTFAAYSAPYTVTFDSNGGSKTPAKQTTDADGKLTSLPDAGTKEGNNFAYWYQKDAAGNETEVKANDTIFTADTTVYAKWNPWSYTVTFDGNGGKVKNSTQTSQDVSATYGTEVIPPDFVKDYYTVTAWARDADGTDKVSSPIKDLATRDGDKITLYAVWEYVPRTVTFNANGVDNNNNPTKGTVTEDGTDKDKVERKTQETPINTLKTLPVPNAQDGYYFEGWYYKDKNDKNKEKLVKVGDTVFTEDTEVYAKWTVFEPVTVTLKCQRGNMTINGKTVTTTTMETKWPGVIDGTLPTAARSGYKFDGWYTAAGVKVTEDTVFLRDTTVYARFTSAVSRTGNPKTGDRAMLGAAVAILVVAAVGLGAAVVINKKKK